MRLRSRISPAPLAAAVASALATAAAQADTAAPAPDTTNWKCEQCPFPVGYTAEAEGGVAYADGANASYGRYTGIDHTGAYAVAAARGDWRDSDGSYLHYRLDNLGLPSRDGEIEGGREGEYALRVSYDGQPTRVYDTTVTPFRSAAPGDLALPANWVYGGTTAAMTQLTQSLTGVNIEYDRRTVSLSGELALARNWTLYTKFSHQEKEGTGLTSGSFLFDATQLPRPIDYVTNGIEAGLQWFNRVASAHLAYTGSWFQDDTDTLTWQNPYLPVAPGATVGRLALPPGNNLQQGSLTGQIQLPVFQATTLGYSVSLGRVTQNAGFLPVSTLPGSTVPAPGALDGDVHLSHYALSLGTRPLSGLYLRGSASYDGRDDHTPALKIPYVLTDALPGATFQTPRYGEDRTRLDGSADYHLWQWIRVGVAGEIFNTHFAPGQVLTHLDETRAWGHVVLTPIAAVSVDLKGGSSRRDASSFNVGALPPAENPLLRAYNYAPRDRNFFSASASWTITPALSWMLEGFWADDAYRLSTLGLQESRDRQLSTTLAWAAAEKLNLYVDGSYQRLAALQNGMINVPGAPTSQVSDAQYYWMAGAGGHWAASDRWDLNLDYVHATTRGNDDYLLSGTSTPFPEIHSQLDSVSLNATYRWTKAFRVRLRYGYEKFDSRDWALDGVSVDTVPNLLTLGQQPYKHTVNLVALSVLWQIDAARSTAKPSE